jgi:hypothetical protein
MFSIADTFSEKKFLQLIMKFNTRSPTKHIVPIFQKLQQEQKKPESGVHLKYRGRKQWLEMCIALCFVENTNEVKHGFTVRNVTAVVANYVRGNELEISECGD